MAVRDILGYWNKLKILLDILFLTNLSLALILRISHLLLQLHQRFLESFVILLSSFHLEIVVDHVIVKLEYQLLNAFVMSESLFLKFIYLLLHFR